MSTPEIQTVRAPVTMSSMHRSYQHIWILVTEVWRDDTERPSNTDGAYNVGIKPAGPDLIPTLSNCSRNIFRLPFRKSSRSWESTTAARSEYWTVFLSLLCLNASRTSSATNCSCKYKHSAYSEGDRWPSALAYHSSEHVKRKLATQNPAIQSSIPSPARFDLDKQHIGERSCTTTP